MAPHRNGNDERPAGPRRRAWTAYWLVAWGLATLGLCVWAGFHRAEIAAFLRSLGMAGDERRVFKQLVINLIVPCGVLAIPVTTLFFSLRWRVPRALCGAYVAAYLSVCAAMLTLGYLFVLFPALCCFLGWLLAQRYK
jgi:hypothetical protein